MNEENYNLRTRKEEGIIIGVSGGTTSPLPLVVTVVFIIQPPWTTVTSAGESSLKGGVIPQAAS